MEEFRSSPIPSVRLQDASKSTDVFDEHTTQEKPPMPRRSTEPALLSSTTSTPSPLSLPYRSRNTSPYARGHGRSRSTASALAPIMARTNSLPGSNGAGHFVYLSQQRPASPLGSPARFRTPKKPVDEAFPGLPSRGSFDGGDRGDIPERSASPILTLTPSGTLPRSRRPSSPLRSINQANSFDRPNHAAASTASSPSFLATRFPDSFPGLYNSPGSFSSSSVPSTPTSARSRSPSISSLETIPDSPDAEEAALEAEKIARLKAAADAADGSDPKPAASSLEIPGGRGRTLGLGYGSRDKRKRWSVCGAERRGDLETVWED